MPRTKVKLTPKHVLPHTESGSNVSQLDSSGKNGSGSNSTQKSSNDDATIRKLPPKGPPRNEGYTSREQMLKPAKSLQRHSREQAASQIAEQNRSRNSSEDSLRDRKKYDAVSNKKNQQKNTSATSLLNPYWAFNHNLTPEKVYSKTLAGLGRPMSRVASAFIADIIPRNGKKKSQVKFTDDNSENDEQITDVEEEEVVCRKVDKCKESRKKEPSITEINRSSQTEFGQRRESKNRGVERSYREKHKKSVIKNPKSTESLQKSSASNSDAEPPADPTVNRNEKIKRRAATPFHPKMEDADEVSQASEKEDDSISTSSRKSTTQLQITGLPLSSTIDDLKQVFPKARAIKLTLIRDNLNRYMRNAVVEFRNTNHAREGYERAKNVRFEDLEVQLDFIAVEEPTPNGNVEEDRSDETIEDLLPQKKIDKESMVREWIKIQSNYAHSMRTKSYTRIKE